MNASRCGYDARLARADICNVRHAAPAVPWPMIGRLAHTVEQQVPRNVVASTEAIVEVKRRPWSVEKDVVFQHCLSRDCLEPHA